MSEKDDEIERKMVRVRRAIFEMLAGSDCGLAEGLTVLTAASAEAAIEIGVPFSAYVSFCISAWDHIEEERKRERGKDALLASERSKNEH